jgi:hypothetical protein
MPALVEENFKKEGYEEKCLQMLQMMQDGSFNKIEKELTCHVTVVWILFCLKAMKPELSEPY